MIGELRWNVKWGGKKLKKRYPEICTEKERDLRHGLLLPSPCVDWHSLTEGVLANFTPRSPAAPAYEPWEGTGECEHVSVNWFGAPAARAGVGWTSFDLRTLTRTQSVS